MSCQHAFMESLRARGFRFTPQREMILEVLHHIPGHRSAEEIHLRVQALSSRVDITTVYRTLELLRGMEFINVIDVGNKGYRYELVGTNPPHPHLVCQSCGDVTDLLPQELFPLAECLERDYGFEAEVQGLTVRGCCAACRADASDQFGGQHG